MDQTDPATPDQRWMTNPNCPDYSSHIDNSFDRLFPSLEVSYNLTPEDWEAIDAAAKAEYKVCEGHS